MCINTHKKHRIQYINMLRNIAQHVNVAGTTVGKYIPNMYITAWLTTNGLLTEY